MITLVKKAPAELRRFISLQMDIRNLGGMEGIGFDFDSQKIVGLKNGQQISLSGEARLDYKRDRKNKEAKMLHSGFSAGVDSHFSVNHQLFSYDHLIAVDTNTNYLDGASISITAAYHIIPKSIAATSMSGLARILAIFELWNVVGKPENMGWWQILQALEGQLNDSKVKLH